MNVLFVIAQLDYADHIAVPFLSAIAKQRGWQTSLCVLDSDNFESILNILMPEVVAYSANVVGFNSIISAHETASRHFDFISILGGPQATFSPETFNQSKMDVYCVGEGEEAFGELLDRIKSGRSYDDIPNLITKNTTNPVRSLISNLDALPLPDRDITLSHSYLKDTPKKTFYATRGCPYKCTYCCNNHYHELYRGKGQFVRRFSVERVIAEIEYVKSRYRTDFVKFGDDCFSLKADSWVEEFADKYSKRIAIPFNCYLRLDTVDDDLLRLLKKAGCYSVHLSVDSTSKHVREKILKRNMRDIDIEATLKKIHSYGINTWVNFMLAAPESTLEDELASIQMCKKGKVTYPSYSTTVPMYGTELYDYCVAHGLLDISSHSSDLKGCSERSALTCFSAREKDVRFNIFLLGALMCKLPFPLDVLAIRMIKVIPSNVIFKKIRQIIYRYYIENKIFRLHS
ncbi:B12-binding domain-containing radical SAM protein [Trichlorobacter thiogenes]|nr:radical SAM protein [Trichlorobacter thiogenes]